MIENLIFIFFVVTFLLLVFVAIQYSRHKNNRFTKSELKKIKEKWDQIYSEKNKHSIIEADKLLDLILKKYGLQGTLADKMRAADKLFSSSNNIWFAHKLRNKIAHEFNFEPSKVELSKALRYFKEAYRDLGVKL